MSVLSHNAARETTVGDIVSLINRLRTTHQRRAADPRENTDLHTGMAKGMTHILNRITAAHLIGRPISEVGD